MNIRHQLFAFAVVVGCVGSPDTSSESVDVRATDGTPPGDTNDTAPPSVVHPLADPRWADVRTVLQDRCRGCHTPAFPHAGLVLSEGEYDAIVGVPSGQAEELLVVEGDAEASYLLHKLRGTHVAVGGSGGRMPAGRDPLEAEVLQTIEVWADAGAPR